MSLSRIPFTKVANVKRMATACTSTQYFLLKLFRASRPLRQVESSTVSPSDSAFLVCLRVNVKKEVTSEVYTRARASLQV